MSSGFAVFCIGVQLPSGDENDIVRNMDRKRTAIRRKQNCRDEYFVTGTPEYRIGLVWPLTREVASLSQKHDAERRLQRHVTRLVRRGG